MLLLPESTCRLRSRVPSSGLECRVLFETLTTCLQKIQSPCDRDHCPEVTLCALWDVTPPPPPNTHTHAVAVAQYWQQRGSKRRAASRGERWRSELMSAPFRGGLPLSFGDGYWLGNDSIPLPLFLAPLSSPVGGWGGGGGGEM